MREFIGAIFDYRFMQHAALAGVLASIACGVAGTYVVVKRISFISGGIAHAVLGGMGIAYYLNADPLLGAIVSALVAAVVLGVVKIRVHQHEDTIIGALWAIGMAIGVIFVYLTPGYSVDLMSFLFGSILMVSRQDIMIMVGLNAVILVLTVLFYRQLLAVCFDEEYARLRGLKVDIIYILLLCMVALTVVTLIRVVGLILVMALLTLPAAIAGLFASNLGKMMLVASCLGLVFTFTGLAVSFQADLPSGAVIILVAALGYLIAVSLRAVISRVATRRSSRQSMPI